MKNFLTITSVIAVTMLLLTSCGSSSSSSSSSGTLAGDTSLVGDWYRTGGTCYNDEGIDNVELYGDGTGYAYTYDCYAYGTWYAGSSVLELVPSGGTCDELYTITTIYTVSGDSLTTYGEYGECIEYWEKY